MSKGFMASDYSWQPSSVSFTSDDKAVQRVFDRCEALCKKNVKMFGCRKVIQEGATYHGVWLETQPMGGEMFAKRDMEAALNNILVFMECQRRDGRMPGMITYRYPWDGLAIHMDWMQGDFFTIPAMRMYYHIGEDRGYLQKLYTALRDFDEYLWTYRDSNGDGCLETWCMWDTGDDNNTRYLVNRVRACEDGSWNGELPPDNETGLPFASAEYMAYSYAQRETLAQISEILGNGEADRWRAAAEDVRRRFREYLWDDERKFAFDRDKFGNKIDSISLENIKCMYQGIFTQEMADDFIRLHLMNPEEFFTPAPLPNLAIHDPLFYLNDQQHNLGDRVELVHKYMHGDIQNNSWSGPVEGLSLQRSIDALLRYGHHAETVLIGRRWLRTLAEADSYVQQFNPFNGKAAIADEGYGPTLLSALEYIAVLCGVRLENRTALWSSDTDGSASDYEQQMYGSRFRLKRTEKEAVAFVDGAEVFRFTHGLRVVSDLQGRPVSLVSMAVQPFEAGITVGGRTFTKTVQPNEFLKLTENGLVPEKKIAFGA